MLATHPAAEALGLTPPLPCTGGFFIGGYMRFVIEYYSHTQRALVLPWRIMVDKPDDHPEYGFTLHEIIDRLGEQIPDAEARQTWPRLRQVFNKHAVQSLTTYEQFFIFVDTKIGCLFVKTWTLLPAM